MEDFYWGQARHGEGEEVADAMSSVVAYERWLAVGDDQILCLIEDYNRQDVRSTLALHDWLEDRRTELSRTLDATGDPPLNRPGVVEIAEADEGPAAAAERELAERLLAAGHELLSGLVGWHRREDRPDWWDFFRRADMAEDDLVDDSAPLGRLGAPEPAGEKHAKNGRVTSRYWRYRFPPQQTKVEVGRSVHDVDTRDTCGSVVFVDTDAGELVLSRKTSSPPATPEE